MMHFQYKGRNKTGEIISGSIDSPSRETAIALLRKDGIIPISLEMQTKQGVTVEELLARLRHRKPETKQLIMFSRQMHSLIRAGVPIIRSIKVVADSMQNILLERALEDVMAGLESGQSLAKSMQKHKDIFPPIVHSLVNIGENSGSLDVVFKQIAIHLEREEETRKQVKAATRYPIMVIITIVIAVAVINVVVIPAFSGFFNKFDTDLPLPTRILVTSSSLTIDYWYLLAAAIGLCTIAWTGYIKTAHGRFKWDRYKLKLPIIGSIIERAVLLRFCRAFALTARTGVPLLEAITVIANTANNEYVKKFILEMRKLIEHGESLTNSAEQSGLFTPLVLQMITIGEETGEVDRLLDEAADFYEEELNYDIKRLSQSIEPIMIGVVAFMVLILALGVFLPMWDIARVAMS